VLGAGPQHLFHIVVDGIAPEQQSSSGVSDDLRVGVFNGREHALRHGGTIEVEVRMDSARDFRLRPRIRQFRQPFVEDIFPGAAHVMANLNYVFHCNL